jgi:aspartate aminotransferase
MGTENQDFVRADRLNGIELSLIVRIQERATALRAEGVDIIGLGTGEPDFDTPEHIKDAATQAMRDGITKYPPTAGTLVLRQAVVDKFARENSLTYATNEVIVSTGAKQVIFNAMMATLNPGDEVIVAAPYWGVYADIVRMCGGVAKILSCPAQDGFCLQPEALDAAIGPRTKWLMLNAPGNPSGATYDAPALGALLDVLDKHPQVWLMSDDIYEHIIYEPDRYAHPIAIRPDYWQRTLIVNGVSKAYAMTGWRIGYGAGPASLIGAMIAVQGHCTSGASSISQAAAVAALNGPQEGIGVRREAFRARRDIIVELLNRADGIDCLTPQGAFYVLPSCVGVLGKRTPSGDAIQSDLDFCQYVLDAEGVAVIPGADFGAPNHFRISYAYAEASLKEACARIERACAALV